MENTAAYLNGWATQLKDNPTWFWDAYFDAKKAADRILGRKYVETESAEESAEAVAV